MGNNRQLILVEWNEINIPLLQSYIQSYPGRFSHLEQLMNCHHKETSSEPVYEHIEPWIQWVSVHTGQTYEQHQVFRLGDIVASDHQQIFETVESMGFKVGCISPMNAKNNLKKPCYFIPDPWTNTQSDQSWWSRRLTQVITQAVNDNAKKNITRSNLMILAAALVRFSKWRDWPVFFRLISDSRKKPWCKAMVLDLLLHQVHQVYFKKYKPDFSTIFFNAGAHIQHHYLFNSKEVQKAHTIKNPSWYIHPDLDPMIDMFDIYNRIVGDYLNQGVALVIATGLSQVPYDQEKFYYRLKHHETFLRLLGIDFQSIATKMSRDFNVFFSDQASALKAKNQFLKIKDQQGVQLFSQIDHRGCELFITLDYPCEITSATKIVFEDKIIDIYDHVVFVAIKNGMHHQKGDLFWSTDLAPYSPQSDQHVSEIYTMLLRYFSKSAMSFAK